MISTLHTKSGIMHTLAKVHASNNEETRNTKIDAGYRAALAQTINQVFTVLSLDEISALVYYLQNNSVVTTKWFGPNTVTFIDINPANRSCHFMQIITVIQQYFQRDNESLAIFIVGINIKLTVLSDSVHEDKDMKTIEGAQDTIKSISVKLSINLDEYKMEYSGTTIYISHPLPTHLAHLYLEIAINAPYLEKQYHYDNNGSTIKSYFAPNTSPALMIAQHGYHNKPVDCLPSNQAIDKYANRFIGGDTEGRIYKKIGTLAHEYPLAKKIFLCGYVKQHAIDAMPFIHGLTVAMQQAMLINLADIHDQADRSYYQDLQLAHQVLVMPFMNYKFENVMRLVSSNIKNTSSTRSSCKYSDLSFFTQQLSIDIPKSAQALLLTALIDGLITATNAMMNFMIFIDNKLDNHACEIIKAKGSQDIIKIIIYKLDIDGATLKQEILSGNVSEHQADIRVWSYHLQTMQYKTKAAFAASGWCVNINMAQNIFNPKLALVGQPIPIPHRYYADNYMIIAILNIMSSQQDYEAQCKIANELTKIFALDFDYVHNNVKLSNKKDFLELLSRSDYFNTNAYNALPDGQYSVDYICLATITLPVELSDFCQDPSQCPALIQRYFEIFSAVTQSRTFDC